jgi:hypothetical protein
MKVVFITNIDKYKGKFPNDFKVIPRVGEFVETETFSSKLPFLELQVVKISYGNYLNTTVVKVELHYSESQLKQAKEYKLNLFD